MWSLGLCRNIHVVTWSVQEYSCGHLVCAVTLSMQDTHVVTWSVQDIHVVTWSVQDIHVFTWSVQDIHVVT